MRRYGQWLAICVLSFNLSACYYYEVDEGKLYRSSQPSADDLEKAAQAGIKTVINLRGASPGADWYEAEKAVTSAHGLLQIDIGMSAGRLPHRSDLIKLLDAFATAPRPILVHCKAGVDRTGEATAIYQMLYMNKTKEESLKMLSEKFGYFEANKPAKIYFIRDLWQGEQWAREEYKPCSGEYKFYDTNNIECQGENPGEDDDT